MNLLISARMHRSSHTSFKHLVSDIRTRTHTYIRYIYIYVYIYTFSHPSCTCPNTLLLSLAEVVAEVVVARRFGNDGRAVGDGDVLKVQEAELNLHREEDLQLAAHGFTTHLPA